MKNSMCYHILEGAHFTLNNIEIVYSIADTEVCTLMSKLTNTDSRKEQQCTNFCVFTIRQTMMMMMINNEFDVLL